MDQFFKSLSKATIAALAIGAGILLIVMSDPPHTLCSAQVDRFNTQQIGLLTPDPAKKETTASFQLDYNRCLESNTPGGCYELFSKMKVILETIDTVDVKCLPNVGSLSNVSAFFGRSIDILLRLAWGGKPPENVTLKFGWLDSADIGLFCRLKDRYLLTYGNDKFKSLIEKAFVDLPGSSGMSRDQSWQLMLFSTNCTSYL